jgi:hypothetical protein
MSDTDKEACLKRIVDLVKNTTGFDALIQGSKVIEPKTQTAKPFYII